MIITIDNKEYTSGIRLQSILNSMTKVEMLKICKKLDLYVSPNLKKEVTAQRLATEILENPVNILSQFCKSELQVLKQLIEAEPNQYVQVKARKTYYKLQKYGLVLTYEDYLNDQWHLLMPNEVRLSLEKNYKLYLKCAEAGIKGPSSQELRMASMMSSSFGVSMQFPWMEIAQKMEEYNQY